MQDGKMKRYHHTDPVFVIKMTMCYALHYRILEESVITSKKEKIQVYFENAEK